MGPCCSCEKEDETVRNLMMMEFRAPVPGTGWGCTVCNLPRDGAVAVICDECLEGKAQITQIIVGFPAEGTRQRFVDTDKLEEFKHDLAYHPGATAHLN